MIRPLAIFVASALVAAAQPPAPSLSMPVLGYVFDANAKAIRLVSGVPGAASLDDPVPSSVSLDSAFVHSRARVAIANVKDGGLALLQWSGTPQTVSLTTSLGRVTAAAFSPSGDSAALTDGALVEVWSGLASVPAKTSAFAPDGGVAALTMNEDGVVAASTAAAVITYAAGQSQAIAAGGEWSSLAFLPNGSDLLAVDSASGRLVLIRNATTNPAASTVLTLDQETDALAVAADGSVAALAGPNLITLASLSGGAMRSVSCACQADHFEQLQGNLVLHLSDPKSGSALVLDADAPSARILTLLSLNGGLAQ